MLVSATRKTRKTPCCSVAFPSGGGEASWEGGGAGEGREREELGGRRIA